MTSNNKSVATALLMSKHSEFKSARFELYKNGVKTSYNDKVAIFSNLQSQNMTNNYFLRECNGLVLELDTWKPLVVPPRKLKTRINTEKSNAFLHKKFYDIYEAEDGSCFNLYYYDNKWVISTTRGHNMNDVKWEKDDKTWQEAIEECLRETVGMTWEEFTKQLDPLKCYSFGMKNPTIHKFWEGRNEPLYKLWFIQSICTDPTSEQYLWSDDQSPIAVIPGQKCLSEKVNELRELYKKASSALDNFLKNGTVCYGFILRSVNTSETGADSDLLVESSLLKAIRNIWYNNNLNNACVSNGWNKELAITLNAYLGRSDNSLMHFPKLFPEYKSYFQQYDTLLTTITEYMVDQKISDDAQIRIMADIFKKCFEETSFDTSKLSKDELISYYTDFVRDATSLNIILENYHEQLLKLVK